MGESIFGNVEDLGSDSMDLDALLGLGDTDIENTSADVKVDTYAEAEETIEYPHWKVNTKKFVDMLKISNIVSQQSGRDVISKAVGLEVKNGDLQVYLSDFDTFVEKSIEIINTNNILEDFIVVNLAIISKLVKACSSLVTVYKKDDKYYIKLIGGDMLLETVKVEKGQLVLKDRNKFSKIGELKTTEFYKSIKSLFVLANASVSPAQRRIFFGSDGISSVFLYCLAKYLPVSDVPEMDIKIKDIKILYALSGGCEDKELEVSKFNNRIVIEANNFTYSFLLSDNKPPKQMLDSMTNVFVNESVYVDFVQLSKIVDLSSDLMYSTSRLDFNYTDDGKVECILRTKKDDSVFTLRGAGISGIEKLPKYVSVQSSLLKVLLKVFSQESTIGINITKDGIGLVSDTFKAVLYTEN